MLLTHPSYERVKNGDGLYYDSISNGPSKQNLWSSGVGENGDGAWLDLSAPVSRDFWAEGVQSLVDLGVDGMWEYVIIRAQVQGERFEAYLWLK